MQITAEARQTDLKCWICWMSDKLNTMDMMDMMDMIKSWESEDMEYEFA